MSLITISVIALVLALGLYIFSTYTIRGCNGNEGTLIVGFFFWLPSILGILSALAGIITGYFTDSTVAKYVFFGLWGIASLPPLIFTSLQIKDGFLAAWEPHQSKSGLYFCPNCGCIPPDDDEILYCESCRSELAFALGRRLSDWRKPWAWFRGWELTGSSDFRFGKNDRWYGPNAPKGWGQGLWLGKDGLIHPQGVKPAPPKRGRILVT